MWLILMIVLAVLSFAGILYLANRIGKFAFIRKITKGKKGFSTLTGLLIAVVYTAVIWMAWGSMNAIVCILHLIVFWMVSEAIFALITKIRKKTFAKYYAGIVAIVLLYVILQQADIRHIMCGRRSMRYRQIKKSGILRWQFFPIHIQERHFMEKVLRNI